MRCAADVVTRALNAICMPTIGDDMESKLHVFVCSEDSIDRSIEHRLLQFPSGNYTFRSSHTSVCHRDLDNANLTFDAWLRAVENLISARQTFETRVSPADFNWIVFNVFAHLISTIGHSESPNPARFAFVLHSVSHYTPLRILYSASEILL